ncbi:TPA: hypothetical protein L4S08_003675 [Pseudomonas aeruginosa]|jgi:hypothetical protein|uniref:hypothetical protein n=1 Tax=Pseudomonas aeruginosa TaxID=287 RepID=UPI000AB1C7FD|nr:hypothetical protein [Pseudomonas aeruginosa]MBG4296168.1 hypothetical protein [Pseudomonas aeruginosa]HBO0303664.1 hypothetical protein [Pseudomonas aeruginosa]HBO0775576.1 hypothetical protein [Pseudomonas aeruginosa]HBO3284708.1 hypothetical protein [Pseudomonas aeruginosa]HEJ4007871.1 hypothetical protein [Pseudomonas aeruginosa]
MADALRPLAWATIYSRPGKEDIVYIGDANPVQERMADSLGLQHRRVQLVEIPAGHVVVPRDVLERSIDRWACCAMSQTPGAEEAWEELRALLSGQEGGKQ